MAIFYGDGSNSNSGRVIQVVSSTYTGAAVHTVQTGYTDYSNVLSVLITPRESGSKILIMVNASFMGSNARDSQGIAIYKNGSVWDAMRGPADGNRSRMTSSTFQSDNDNACPVSAMYLDSPNTTSQIRYTVGLYAHQNNQNVALNRDWNYNNGNNSCRNISTLTCMEIAN